MLLAVVWVEVVVVVGGGCAACIGFGTLFLASATFSSSVVPSMCLRFRGCPVVLDVERSVSARY